MKYAPATLKVSEYAVSALYLATEKAEYVLALSSEAVRLAGEGHDAAVSLGSDASNVYWHGVVLEASAEIASSMQAITDFGPQFSFTPALPLVVAVFRFADRGSRDIDPNVVRDFYITADPARYEEQRILIQSSPFAGVNAALFHGYTSTGVVSRVDGHLLLVDARYLDGMEGGAVFTQLGNSALTGARTGAAIGLVAGSIVKESGEGRLTAVVPWTAILDLPLKINHELRKAAKSVARPATDLGGSKWPGIVTVYAYLKGNRRSWGSGVLVAPDLVVTNKHVVGDAALRLEAWFEKYNRIPIVTISQPLEGADLVVLKLLRPAPGKFRPFALAQNDPQPGTKVRSLGFGLFAPRNSVALQPLYSEGIVTASKQNLDMLVVSASCWNGSSGGAVADWRTGKLVGVMASNARDDVSGEIMPDMAFVIPVSVVSRALTLFAQSQTAHTSDTFKQLWSLKRTHRDAKL